MSAIKCLLVALMLSLAGLAHAAPSKSEPLKLSVSLKLPAASKPLPVKTVIQNVINKLEDKPKPVLTAVVKLIKVLPKIIHHGPPPYGCGSGGGGHGCGCHASKH